MYEWLASAEAQQDEEARFHVWQKWHRTPAGTGSLPMNSSQSEDYCSSSRKGCQRAQGGLMEGGRVRGRSPCKGID